VYHRRNTYVTFRRDRTNGRPSASLRRSYRYGIDRFRSRGIRYRVKRRETFRTSVFVFFPRIFVTRNHYYVASIRFVSIVRDSFPLEQTVVSTSTNDAIRVVFASTHTHTHICIHFATFNRRFSGMEKISRVLH